MERLIGKIVNDRYRIMSIVGVGGMAVVYRAVDIHSDKTVAIKVLKYEFLEDEGFKTRFENESKAISILNHKNIVKIHDVSLNDDLYYIVMEYLDGITLKQYIKQQGKIGWRETLFLVGQTLSALKHAHDSGIVHRDIKPQNIMLLQDGSIKVTDFGIARFSHAATSTMTDKAIGSVHYISPEQVSAQGADPRSDIYSIGIVMYEMLTGELPFDAENTVSVALMQLQTAPKPPKEHNPNIPEGLEEIILRCMAKNPDNRYESTEALVDDIERFKQNPSIRFEYKYMSDESPTKYIDAIKTIKSEEEFDSEEGRKSYVGIITGIMAAVAILAAAFVLLVSRPWEEQMPTDVEIPRLLGLDIDEVISDVENYGNFRIVELQRVYNDDYEEGEIFSQSPVEGMVVKPGADIRVSVSLGPKTAVVPDVEGKNYIQAEIDIEKLGLTTSVLREYSDTVVEDHVIRTEPAIGAELAEGEVVEIYVSQGAKIEKVYVPHLVDLTENEARGALTQVGLVASVSQVVSDKPYGVVVYQGIESGAQVDEGTVVSIEISDGSLAPVEKQITVSFPQSPSSFTLEIKKSGETVYSEIHYATERSAIIVLTGRGTEIVEIYIDDTLKESGFVDFT